MFSKIAQHPFLIFFVGASVTAVLIFASYVYTTRTPALCEIGTHTLKLKKEIAVTLRTTEAEQREGLSGKKSLADNEGMLFVFDSPTSRGFWMKDMRFAIDIISLDMYMRVVGIIPNATPESYPRVFYTPETMQYTLEVPSGFAQKEGIVVGDKASVVSECPR